MPVGDRKDPYLNYQFLVEIQGLVIAGFSEVSGLQAETQVEEYREGGVNDFIHRLPKETRHPNLVFKRGMTDSDALWRWHQDVVNGKVARRSGSVVMLDTERNAKWRWNFTDAYPVKWSGPEFRGDGNTVAFEAIELVHRGIKKA